MLQRPSENPAPERQKEGSTRSPEAQVLLRQDQGNGRDVLDVNHPNRSEFNKARQNGQD